MKLHLKTALVTIGLALGATGCLGDDDLGGLPNACASLADFDNVSPIMELQCGSLDCHGAVGRPLLIFGQNGRRRPGSPDDGSVGYSTGGSIVTTAFEREGSWLSICGLQPEVMNDVVNGAAEPTSLTMVRKARLDEKHKGGQVWAPDDSADVCLQSWLRGAVDVSACAQARIPPPQ